MAITTIDRPQRLETLERHIVKLAAQIHKNGLEIGRDLIEIRDNHLWKKDYDSWNQYLKDKANELVNRSFSHAKKMIQSAEVANKLSSTRLIDEPSAEHYRELSRLVPNVAKKDGKGAEKDYTKLKKTEVEKVVKAAAKLSTGEKVTVGNLKKAIDTHLGVNSDTRKKPKEPGIDLHQFLLHAAETVETTMKHVDGLSVDIWTLLDDEHPKLRERVAASCDRLAEFLRS